MDIILFIGANKLEAIKVIRELTGSSLKNAKDLVELAEKNYTVAISDVPREYESKVMQTLFAAGISAQICDGRTSIFRKIPFAPSAEIPAAEYSAQNLGNYQPTPLVINKKTDGSLKGYLKTVALLECQRWNQDRLLNSLNVQILRLGQARKFDKPNISDFYKIDDANGTLVFMVLSLIPTTVISILVAGFTRFIFGILAFVVIGFANLCIFNMLFDRLQRLLAAPIYRKKMEQYNAKVAADQRRIQQELKLKQEIGKQIASVKAERYRTQNALTALYSLSIIHKDYRNLVAVSSFYDYLDKGICTKLTGRDGAYAFYEEALRFNRIEAKLDIIIEKLDEIAANQQYLASLIRDGNATLNRIEHQNNSMLRKMDTIRENTAVTAYNTQCCAESMSVMESISLYHYLKY